MARGVQPRAYDRGVPRGIGVLDPARCRLEKFRRWAALMMSAQGDQLPGIGAVTRGDQSVAAMVEEMLGWQTLAINRLQTVGLIMSTAAARDVGSVTAARDQSRALLCRVLDDVEHTLRLLELDR